MRQEETEKDMKKLISIIIISLGFLPLMAQNDYYIRQAQSYQREAEYYTKQALGYEREVAYSTNKRKVISERVNAIRSGRSMTV